MSEEVEKTGQPGQPEQHEPPDDGSIESPKGGPRRLLIAGAVAAVVFVALVVATRGDDTGGGGCLSGLADHLGNDSEVVTGSDIGRLEDAGYDVASNDGLVDAGIDVAFQPDPINGRLLLQFDDDPEATAGYAPDDVDCWVGNQAAEFVAAGDFDADRVADTELADDLAVDGDLLAYDRDDPDAWLETSSDDPPARTAVQALDDLGVVTFSGMTTGSDDDEPHWVGLGVAHPDDWELAVVWVFADADQAESSTDTVVDAVGEGEVPSMIEGDVADLIERDGAVLTLRAPLRGEASEWRTPLVQLDPMFGALLDFGDGDSDSD